MKRYRGFLLMTAVLFAATNPARADEQDAKAILDKAIKALGGEEKLKKASVYSWNAKGKVTVGGLPELEFTAQGTTSGLDHYRRETVFARYRSLVVLDGDKGWHRARDNIRELTGGILADAKRLAYLEVIPVTLMPIKGKGFKYETAAEEIVGEKTAVVLKVTGPDGKDFTISFDKETGVPVKQVAKVVGLGGMAYTAETTYLDYKDFGGIQRATRIVVKRDGEEWQTMEITEFKVLDKVEPDTFAEPK